jgi:translation initiation factor 3 subunit A
MICNQEIGRMAFAFCLRNRRTAEFRRLTELLRSHLISAQKYQQQVNATNLRASETVQGFLETRFEQLRVAYELELWQEAYRSIEDIHGLVQLSKKTPKAHLMASYFEKLAHIFHLSGNQMFHAYALFRFYTFSLLSGPTQVLGLLLIYTRIFFLFRLNFLCFFLSPMFRLALRPIAPSWPIDCCWLLW